MRASVTRKTIAAVAVALVLPAAAGCKQAVAFGRFGAQADLKIVPQMSIDQNGSEIKAEAGTTPATPAGDGKATCPAGDHRDGGSAHRRGRAFRRQRA